MNPFIKSFLIVCGLGFTVQMLQPAFHSPITSPEAALQRLESTLLPSIEVMPASGITVDSAVNTPAAVPGADRLPAVEAFPLYGADALPQNPARGVLRIEIVSSVEKADGRHPEHRWLVDVAERFNQRRERTKRRPALVIIKHEVTMTEGASTTILPAQPNGSSLKKQGAESKGLSHAPLNPFSGLNRLHSLFNDLRKLRMWLKRRGEVDQRLSD